MLSALEVSETAIIKSAAHAQPVAACVEANQRCQHQIQCVGFDAVCMIDFWFCDAVTISNQGCVWLIADEPQTVIAERAQYGQIYLLSRCPGAFNQEVGIDFAVSCEIDRNAPAVTEQTMPHEFLAEDTRASLMLARFDGESQLAKFLALVRTACHGCRIIQNHPPRILLLSAAYGI